MPDTKELIRPDDTVIDRVKPKREEKVERPKLYKVLLVNDHTTPFELVVSVLEKVFGVGREKAIQIMWAAHTQGICVVAVFTRDIAETKSDEGRDMALAKGHNLVFDVEPEE